VIASAPVSTGAPACSWCALAWVVGPELADLVRQRYSEANPSAMGMSTRSWAGSASRMLLNIQGRAGIISQMRTTAVLAVALLVLAPSVVRALQPLDCGPSPTGLTFSRSSPVPPVRVQVLPPDEAVLAVAHADGPGFDDLTFQPPLTDEAAPALLRPAPPDPTRGPPLFSLL